MCCEDEVIPTPSTPCGYTGEDIPCVGIVTGDAIEIVIQKITDYLCALECCSESSSNLIYSSERALGYKSVVDIPDAPSVISGATYTITEDGDYEVQYVGEYHTTTSGTLNLKLFKNLSEYSVITSKTLIVPVGPSIVGFSILATNIGLVIGDVISIRGSSTVGTYPQNAVFKLTKIS